MNDTIPLRPHHAVCIRFFRGKGYSPEFAAHMAAVIAGLKADAPVRIVLGADTICSACPGNNAGTCDTAVKSDRYDAAVLKLCGLAYGDELSYGELAALIAEKVIECGLREEVCGDCEWSDICR